MLCCAARLRCLPQQGHRARGVWALQGWVLQGCCSPWWPWDGWAVWCGVGGSLGRARAVLLVQVGQAAHSMGLSHSPALGCSKASQFPFKASSTHCTEQGGKKRPPPAKTAKESESQSL